jgi:pyridoxine 5-phosphate synthase
VQVAVDCEKFGAEGITVHPRPDERHIRYQDVLDLAKVVTTEFNIEGYPDQRYIDLVLRVKPAQATLVPDPPTKLTSDEGWDTVQYFNFLQEVIKTLQAEGVRVSVFVNAAPKMVEYAAKAGADRVELYTGIYAHDFEKNPVKAIQDYVVAAQVAQQCNLGLNAGHDLNLANLAFFKQHISNLAEVSIGHALISDALYFGLENTIQRYLNCLK